MSAGSAVIARREARGTGGSDWWGEHAGSVFDELDEHDAAAVAAEPPSADHRRRCRHRAEPRAARTPGALDLPVRGGMVETDRRRDGADGDDRPERTGAHSVDGRGGGAR